MKTAKTVGPNDLIPHHGFVHQETLNIWPKFIQCAFSSLLMSICHYFHNWTSLNIVDGLIIAEHSEAINLDEGSLILS